MLCYGLGMANNIHNISDEQLEQAILNSLSMSHALRLLGISPNGGTHGHYSARAKKAGISTEHFKPNRNVYGILKSKLKPEEILILKSEDSMRTGRKYLLRALLESGVSYVCVSCKNNGTWLGKAITLQIDHIDGNRNNNVITNLRFLCPNCHSQTETYGTKKPRLQCSKCSEFIQRSNRTGFCRSCAPRTKKINWPNKEELLEMLANSNYTQVSKKLGVSDNAIRKHLNNLG